MARDKETQAYALEMTAIFVAGLGMMLLVLISVWIASLVVVGSAALSDESVGTLPSLTDDSDRIAFLENLETDAGQVAGVVDDSSVAEDNLRNEAVNWLSNVRKIQLLDVAYRDSVLDRNAQNHARLIATSCSDARYSDWSESLGTRVDEGYTSSFSEAVFSVSGNNFAGELPNSRTDYSRLFTFYDAVGVGVAQIPDAANCGSGFVMVFHVAQVD